MSSFSSEPELEDSGLEPQDDDSQSYEDLAMQDGVSNLDIDSIFAGFREDGDDKRLADEGNVIDEHTDLLADDDDWLDDIKVTGEDDMLDIAASSGKHIEKPTQQELAPIIARGEGEQEKMLSYFTAYIRQMMRSLTGNFPQIVIGFHVLVSIVRRIADLSVGYENSPVLKEMVHLSVRCASIDVGAVTALQESSIENLFTDQHQTVDEDAFRKAIVTVTNKEQPLAVQLIARTFYELLQEKLPNNVFQDLVQEARKEVSSQRQERSFQQRLAKSKGKR